MEPGGIYRAQEAQALERVAMYRKPEQLVRSIDIDPARRLLIHIEACNRRGMDDPEDRLRVDVIERGVTGQVSPAIFDPSLIAQQFSGEPFSLVLESRIIG